MDKQLFSFYRKNTIYLFVIAALLMAVSILATVLVLVPANQLINQTPVILTILLWIALLLGTILGESKEVTTFNMVVSVLGFICSFALAASMFVSGRVDALSTFLFWVSQILSAVFILSSYFSIQAFLETQKKKTRKRTTRKTTKKKK
jgi:hypothetical protein